MKTMNRMKKWIAFLTFVMMISMAAFTGAEETGVPAEGAVMRFYDAATELLFETENVTLSGKAVFSLDGERFKSAEIRYVQDGRNSLLQLDLLTPRRDGSGRPDRESGYTVIANGELVYVTEVINPGVYKTGTTFTQNTILRKSVQMELMANLMGMLAKEAETLLGKDAVTILPDETAGLELRITLDRDVPEMVNTSANLFYQFIARRYFETDYDTVSERYMGPMENYLTVTQGILECTKSLSVEKAEITMKLDDQGFLKQVSGDVSLMLVTGKDGIRRLDFVFSLDVSNRGSSHVDDFDPDAYGVVLADGYAFKN